MRRWVSRAFWDEIARALVWPPIDQRFDSGAPKPAPMRLELTVCLMDDVNERWLDLVANIALGPAVTNDARNMRAIAFSRLRYAIDQFQREVL